MRIWSDAQECGQLRLKHYESGHFWIVNIIVSLSSSIISISFDFFCSKYFAVNISNCYVR